MQTHNNVLQGWLGTRTVGFSDKVQMEVIIIITSLSSAGLFNAARAPSADSPF